MTRGEASRGEALYLYGFLPVGAPVPPEDLPGIADRPVETVGLDFGLAAVSRVPTDDYAAEVIEERMRDLDWLAEQGLGHERVVTWFVDEAWILPARLLTLYSSAEALRREAGERAAYIREALERMEGYYEWDLKVSYVPERLTENMGELSREVQQLEEEIADTSPGRGYLLGRVKDEKVRSGASEAARLEGERLLDRIGGMAEDVIRVELPEATADRPVVLSAALLAPRDAGERLEDEARRRAEDLGDVGIRVEVSGPWAPYRFLGEGGDADDREGGAPGAGRRRS